MVIFWSFDQHILVLHPSCLTKSRKQQMAELKNKKLKNLCSLSVRMLCFDNIFKVLHNFSFIIKYELAPRNVLMVLNN